MSTYGFDRIRKHMRPHNGSDVRWEATLESRWLGSAHLRVNQVLEATAAHTVVAGEHNPAIPLSGTGTEADRAFQLALGVSLWQLTDDHRELFLHRALPLVNGSCEVNRHAAVSERPTA